MSQLRFGEHSELVTADNPLPVYFVGGVGGGEVADGSITTEKFAPDAKSPFAGAADSATTATTANSVTWANVSSKPTTFTPTSHTHNASEITAGTLATARIPSITTGMFAVDAKTPFSGTADTANSVTWTNVSGKPTAFTPATHTHVIGDITGLQTAIDAKITATKAETQENSTATDVTGLVSDFNALLAKLKSAGLMV